MNDALWDFYGAIDDADMKLRKYFDRMNQVYEDIPEDMRGNFESIRRRLENCEEVMDTSSKLLQKVKEIILENERFN